MDNQEILDGNKLISEFMEVDFSKEMYSYRVGVTEPLRVGHLAYHKEWGWLMQVVGKIISLGWQFQLNSYGVSNDAKFINGENYIQNVAWATPLSATYNVVVDFINWHNQHKK